MYCTKCGTQIGEDRRFCTKCGTAFQRPEPEPWQGSHKFTGARYFFEGRWAWYGVTTKSDLELAEGRLKFKGGEIGIEATTKASLVRQPFPWWLSGVLLAIGILAFVIGLSMGGDAGMLLRSIGVGGVVGSVGSAIGWLIGRGNQWLLVEYSGQNHAAQKVYFKMSKQETESLYSILQSRVKR